jgi:hypothetical protein
MVKTFSDGKRVYSVDMMLAYINIFKPKVIKVPVADLEHSMDSKGWWDGKQMYSAADVLKNPKKYKEEMKKIEDANLNYPIIIKDKKIIDGVHRLSKASMQKKKYIKCHEFTKDLLWKFRLPKDYDWRKKNKLEPNELIELFWKRFSA